MPHKFSSINYIILNLKNIKLDLGIPVSREFYIQSFYQLSKTSSNDLYRWTYFLLMKILKTKSKIHLYIARTILKSRLVKPW